jgi:hypothetical protein
VFRDWRTIQLSCVGNVGGWVFIIYSQIPQMLTKVRNSLSFVVEKNETFNSNMKKMSALARWHHGWHSIERTNKQSNKGFDTHIIFSPSNLYLVFTQKWKIHHRSITAHHNRRNPQGDNASSLLQSMRRRQHAIRFCVSSVCDSRLLTKYRLLLPLCITLLALFLSFCTEPYLW